MKRLRRWLVNFAVACWLASLLMTLLGFMASFFVRFNLRIMHWPEGVSIGAPETTWHWSLAGGSLWLELREYNRYMLYDVPDYVLSEHYWVQLHTDGSNLVFRPWIFINTLSGSPVKQNQTS